MPLAVLNSSSSNDLNATARRVDRYASLGLFALVVAAGTLRMAPGVCGVYHDDAIYVDTGAALASGEGYRLLHVPGTPPQTKYPVLYPAMLALLWRSMPHFPQNLQSMQFFSLICAAAYLATGYLYLVRRGYFSRNVAFAAAILTGTSSSTLYFATTTMAEMPFALVLVASLWLLDRFLIGEISSRCGAFSVGMAAALPFLCRTIGAPLVPLAIWLAWRQRRRAFWAALGAGTLALPWAAWSQLGRGHYEQSQVAGYYTDYFGCWTSTGFAMFFRVLAVNAFNAAHGVANLTAEGLCELAGNFAYRGLPAMGIAVIGLFGWWRAVRRCGHPRALPAFLAAYLGIVLVWSWPPHRFLIPIQLYGVAYLLEGIVNAVNRWEAIGATRRIAWVATAWLVVANVLLLTDHARFTRDSGYPLIRRGDVEVAWSDYVALFDWLRASSQPDDVIASGMDSMVALYTDRTAFRPYIYRPGALFYGDDAKGMLTPSELVRILRTFQPKYLVEAPMSGFAEDRAFFRVLTETAQRYPRWIRKVYVGRDRRFAVYELSRPDEPGGDALASSAGRP